MSISDDEETTIESTRTGDKRNSKKRERKREMRASKVTLHATFSPGAFTNCLGGETLFLGQSAARKGGEKAKGAVSRSRRHLIVLSDRAGRPTREKQSWQRLRKESSLISEPALIASVLIGRAMIAYASHGATSTLGVKLLTNFLCALFVKCHFATVPIADVHYFTRH
ncbi:hypothetical protein TYRP_007885 [Tyrophagus putrescentiae]|nr:hypothetical protein TYRP_007885 [Tyrophagus putrescentiae]